MSGHLTSVGAIVEQILNAPRTGGRRLVALAGAPASGKSTLAETLASELCESGCQTAVVPMDGFHLHNQFLVKRGLLNRKGAPETFDVNGFVHLVARLHDEAEVYYPIFDRTRDISIAGGGQIDSACDTVIVEGNYLLFDSPHWRSLAEHWDLALRLDVPFNVVEKRLVERWLSHGLSQAQAQARASENDLANARLITQAQMPADFSVLIA
jgi:fructokinase